MFLKLWRLITLILTALTTGMSFAHVLELPIKRSFSAEDYLSVQKSLYEYYGTVGAAVESSWLFGLVLSLLVRKRRSAFSLTLAGTLCLILSQVVWWACVRPVNAQVVNWTSRSLPSNWKRVRDQWEYAHAGRFVLHLTSLILLVLSDLPEKSGTAESTRHL